MAEGTRGRPVPHLRLWRMYRALSLVDLARRARVSLSTIERAERITHPAMSWESIRRVADALDIRPDQLWGEHPPNGGEAEVVVPGHGNGNGDNTDGV